MPRFLVALGCCLFALPRFLSAQADTSAFGVRLSFAQPPLTLETPGTLRAPWMGAPRVSPGIRAAAFDSMIVATLDTQRVARAAALRLQAIYGTGPEPEDSLREHRRNPLGLPTKYADLSLDGQARLEIRTDRVREERCSPILALEPNSGCRGKFKAPSLDDQVNIRSTGVLGQRIHVNVDFDAQRDYGGNNNVQIYYEGLQDEIVRRIDVGTVTFTPPASRFITAGVPANNFGVNATFEVGPLQLQTLAAAGGEEVDAADAEENALPAFRILDDEGAFLLAHRDHLKDLAEPDRRKVAFEGHAFSAPQGCYPSLLRPDRGTLNSGCAAVDSD